MGCWQRFVDGQGDRLAGGFERLRFWWHHTPLCAGRWQALHILRGQRAGVCQAPEQQRVGVCVRVHACCVCVCAEAAVIFPPAPFQVLLFPGCCCCRCRCYCLLAGLFLLSPSHLSLSHCHTSPRTSPSPPLLPPPPFWLSLPREALREVEQGPKIQQLNVPRSRRRAIDCVLAPTSPSDRPYARCVSLLLVASRPAVLCT